MDDRIQQAKDKQQAKMLASMTVEERIAWGQAQHQPTLPPANTPAGYPHTNFTPNQPSFHPNPPGISDWLDSAEDWQGLAEGGTLLNDAGRRLLWPGTPGVGTPSLLNRSSTWTEIATEDWWNDIQRGTLYNEPEVISAWEAAQAGYNPAQRISYTDLDNFATGARQFGNAAINLTPLGLQIGAMAVGDSNPQLARDLSSSGQTLNGGLNVWQGASQAYQTYQSVDWVTTAMRSPLSKGFVGLQGAVGLFDYAQGANRLINDPTIVPGAPDPNAWTERVGVGTQSIGGALLAAGAACAIFGGLPGIAVAMVLLPAGATFEGAGLLMQNWGWVTETAGKISDWFH